MSIAAAYPGRFISHAEMRGMLRIAEPVTVDQYKQMLLDVLDGVSRLKEALLRDHFVDLDTVHGKGYRIVPPGQQTELALRDGRKEMRKALLNMGRRIRYVDHAALTADEHRENADAVAKLSKLREIADRPLRTLLPRR